MLRRGMLPATLVIAVSLAIWLLSGVPVNQILIFLGYEIGFVALPGVAVVWALLGRRPGFLAAVGLGWPAGSALELLAFSATAAAGVRILLPLYPVVTIALSGLVIWRRRRPPEAAETGQPMSSGILWTAAATLSLGLVYLALMFLPAVPLPSNQASVAYSPDFVYQMSKVAEVLYHWPPTNPGLSGVPLPYEWFVFFHMAAVSQITHIAIPIIALRLDFVPLVIVIGCQLLMLGRALAGAAWAGVVAIVVVFLLGPLDLTTDTKGAVPFFNVFNSALWASWTLPFGLMFFLALLSLTNDRLRATAAQHRVDIGFWALMTLLMIGAAGAKATILPVLLTGTALYIAITRLTRKTFQPAALVMFGLETVIFVLTFLVIYRGGAAGTGFDPLASLARTFPVIHASDGAIPIAIRAVIVPLAYVGALAGMLLPLAGILYLFRRRHRGTLSAYTLCLCLLGAGLLIANLFHQTGGYSELYFQDTGYVAGCIVAAAGLRLAWLDAGTAFSISRRAAVVSLAGWVLVLALFAVVTALTLRLAPSEVTMYSLLGGGGVLFVIAWRWLARRRGHATSAIWALALIPLVAAAALTSPIQLAPTVGRVLTGTPITVTKPDPDDVRGLTPLLLTALAWLRNNSPVDTIFAVNNHWVDPDEKDGRYYYYSAFSERQVFIEGYDPNRYQINTDVDTPEGADFARRQVLNNAVFTDADAEALGVMTQQYGVRFLFIDTLDIPANPAVSNLGNVVFTNADATIIAVGGAGRGVSSRT